MHDILEWASERPLFTINEAERVTDITRASLREKLSRLVSRGALARIERGKYTVHDDPLIYATYVAIPSYLSLWSGLRFYDLTTQHPTTAQVMVATNRRDLPDVEFYQTGSMFGYGTERYEGFDVFVAKKERLLLDCLARKQVPVAHLADLVGAVDIETATAYADRLGRHAVAKRLGYLFDHLRGVTVETLRIRDRNYPSLDLANPPEGDTDAKWRLRVNTDVAQA